MNLSEGRPLKTNQSFQSDQSSISVSELVEISLTGGLDIPSVIYEKEEAPTKIYKPHAIAAKSEELLKIDNFDTSLLPLIIKFLNPSDLQSAQLVSWQWAKIASEQLYKYVSFSQLSGSKLKVFLDTLMKSVLKGGKRATTFDYIAMIKYLSIKQIVFEEPSRLQSWASVKDVIGLTSKSLIGLELDISDESFLDLQPDYIYLMTNIDFPNLSMLRLTSKCQKLPQTLVLELLRASGIGKLKSVKFTRCMANFDSSGWFLLLEKGGESLVDLVLTPSAGPNMLGWDEKGFNQGLESIAKTCTKLSRLDLSGHIRPIPHKALELLCSNTHITEFYSPCTINDAHLLIMMEFAAWESLKVLGLNCMCVDGEMREKKKEGMSCNRFTDHVLLQFLEHWCACPDPVTIYLPSYLIALKTGKRIETSVWLGIHAKKNMSDDTYRYKEKLNLSVKTNRLAHFL